MHVMNLLKAGQVCLRVNVCVMMRLMFPVLSEAISPVTQILAQAQKQT